MKRSIYFLLFLSVCIYCGCNIDEKFKGTVPTKGILSELGKDNFNSLVICLKKGEVFIEREFLNEEFTKEYVLSLIKKYSLDKSKKVIIIDIFSLNIDWESYSTEYNKVKGAKDDYLNGLSLRTFEKEYQNLTKAEKKSLGLNIVINENKANEREANLYCM